MMIIFIWWSSATDRTDKDTEDMIAELKVDNCDYRKTNDDDDDDSIVDVDSEVIPVEVGSNGNDHEESVVDDTTIIEPVLKDDITDES